MLNIFHSRSFLKINTVNHFTTQPYGTFCLITFIPSVTPVCLAMVLFVLPFNCHFIPSNPSQIWLMYSSYLLLPTSKTVWPECCVVFKHTSLTQTWSHQVLCLKSKDCFLPTQDKDELVNIHLETCELFSDLMCLLHAGVFSLAFLYSRHFLTLPPSPSAQHSHTLFLCLQHSPSPAHLTPQTSPQVPPAEATLLNILDEVRPATSYKSLSQLKI